MAKKGCQKQIEDLGVQLETCQMVHEVVYARRDPELTEEWGRICNRLENRLKKQFLKCER